MRANFLTGLAVVLPTILTFYVVWTFAGFVDDRILPLIPDAFNPLIHYELQIRGVGIIVFVVFTTFVGAVAKGYVGRQVVRLVEAAVDRTPVVRWIYNGAKQIIETILNQQNATFQTACLVEYPRKGIWAVAFISTSASGEVLGKGEPGRNAQHLLAHHSEPDLGLPSVRASPRHHRSRHGNRRCSKTGYISRTGGPSRRLRQKQGLRRPQAARPDRANGNFLESLTPPHTDR